MGKFKLKLNWILGLAFILAGLSAIYSFASTGLTVLFYVAGAILLLIQFSFKAYKDGTLDMKDLTNSIGLVSAFLLLIGAGYKVFGSSVPEILAVPIIIALVLTGLIAIFKK